VLSPNPRIGKTAERVRWFAEYVRECWLVHQDERTLTVLRLADDRIDPGLSLDEILLAE
jgi:hypothetical protein